MRELHCSILEAVPIHQERFVLSPVGFFSPLSLYSLIDDNEVVG